MTIIQYALHRYLMCIQKLMTTELSLNMLKYQIKNTQSSNKN